ncbi:hypothetical protein ACFPT7_21520 [Acidicapsa dinghuensis]|uniref:Uncharacterized protein n=1 Tax=Acidicapsa dinghuensis TaxID=2218256 RepID=A0ABW1EMB0_9BACT|nr:hypothetical protein [Acidicapsa dinghuensis]
MAQGSMFPDLNTAYAGGGVYEPEVKYKLYDSGAVSVATFLGGPIAGAALMAMNYRKLGKTGAAMGALGVGVIGMALGIAVGYLLPSGASYAVPIALIYGMRQFAEKTQGDLIEEHTERGGQLGSMVIPVALGLAILIPVLAAIFLPVMMQPHNQVRVGTKDMVVYTGQASRQDADDLGQELKRVGYFQDQGAEVFLDKDAKGATISLVVKDGWWDKPGAMDAADEVARQVAKSVGGFPVRVRLVDIHKQVKKSGSVGHSYAGPDDIYFYDDATQENASALMEAMRRNGDLRGSGDTTLLRKRDGVTQISYVLGMPYWNEAARVRGFEQSTRAVAYSVGGLPVTMRLTDNSLNSEFEEVVR